jgi:hypothetical protein
MAKGKKTGGRIKGTPNKTTTDVGAVARALVDDAAYREAFKKRFQAGDVPPGVEQMIWHYAYGKPPDSLQIGGMDGGPVMVRFVDA